MNNSQLDERQGFTLIELLVVIGIIATLIGLLLPTVRVRMKVPRAEPGEVHADGRVADRRA